VTRIAVAAVCMLVLVASAAGATGPTALTITIWPDERKQTVQRYRLACAPARGTLPRAAVACARLAAGWPALFRPPPPDQACIEVYGGPQRAIVAGTVSGRNVWVSLRRRDGCEIERWRKLSFLLPVEV
jgi:subtilisin inhibitor-like